MAYPYTSYQSPYQQGYYQQYQQAQYQPQMQQIQQQTQQAVNQPAYYTGRIWVNGKSEVDFYPVAPNNAVDLWDRNGTTLYQKKADATGKPSVTTYDVTERTQAAMDGDSASGGNTAYATKDELSAVVGVVKGFDSLISSMKSEIEKMSGDLYGIAGKKKTARKGTAEGEEDE